MRSDEVRDGMQIIWDAPITASDGIILRADVFRPLEDGRIPAIVSYGPYAKGMSFAESRPFAWQRLLDAHPIAMAVTSNKYQAWELPDPENWVQDGYAVVRVDARGTGRSPGFMDPWSPRETQDIYECIAWVAAQPWSNGKIGMSGISYYAMNQYQAAALRPPALKAICAWEGAGDHYRDVTYHGGIFSEFITNWYPRAAMTMQHGVGERGMRSPVTGELVAGPETLSQEELARNHSDIVQRALEHPLDDGYHGSGARIGRKLPFLCSPQQTGADRACIPVATSRPSGMLLQSRNGSKHTAIPIGPNSTAATALNSKSDSSVTSSRAKIPAGIGSPRSCSTFVMPAEKLMQRAEANGRSLVRAGPLLS